MSKQINIIAVAIFFVFLLFSSVFCEESISITTYYPSPYGSYNELTTTGNTYLATTSGNVGIGLSNPTSRLEVVKSGGTVAEFNRTTSDGTIISLQQDGAEEGTISVSGNTVSYNGFTGSHFGWSNGNIAFKIGELLIATGENKTSYKREFGKGETVYGVARTYVPNDKRVFGVYSGEGELGEEKWYLINAVGDGFILVTDTNGDIEVGDYITSSKRAGYGQKQIENSVKNYTVGKAMQNVRWAEEKNDPELGFKLKLIACTFKAS